ncbi:MmgE/PrpD family protein [soil metagenome]
MTLVLTLGSFAADVTYEMLTRELRTAVKDHVLDTIGVSLAAVPLESSRMALKLAGPSSEEATVLGFGRHVAAGGAAFVNGVLAHSLDFDDTHLPSVLHPSASIVPAALASGQASDVDSRAVIAAAAAGYEICIRLGMAGYDRQARNSVFFEKGWHATSICGTIAAAAVAGKLFGLDAEGISNAMGIAVSFASGVLEANRTGGSVKRLHCGWAAQSGIAAANAARAGFTAPHLALEGGFGFYRAFCDGRFDESDMLDNLGEKWAISDIFYKPYPANHFTHAAIDACLKLRTQVELDDISTIEVGVATTTLRTIAEPRQAKLHPESGYHAQFSAPFAVAAALIGGGGLGVWLDDFSDRNVRDELYLKVAAKVQCLADPRCDAIFPDQFPAFVSIRTKSGKTLEEKVLCNRGGPGNPLTSEELQRKFLVNARRVLDESQSRMLADAIAKLEDVHLSTLMALATVVEPLSQAQLSV